MVEIDGNNEPRPGSLRPVRLAEWNERDGVIVVECPKPQGPWYREIAAWLAWLTGPQRIRLDDLGSDCWRRFDGVATLEQITAEVTATLPDDQKGFEHRISLFLRVLIDRRMVRLDS